MHRKRRTDGEAERALARPPSNDKCEIESG
jgi:hypothetical protein